MTTRPLGFELKERLVMAEIAYRAQAFNGSAAQLAAMDANAIENSIFLRNPRRFDEVGREP